MATEDTMETSGSKLRRLCSAFDLESAAVVTILLGLFQLLLSAALAFTDQILPKLFIMPIFLGMIIVTGGSFTMANERNPSRTLLCGCACSHVLGVLGSLLAFGLYCYTLKTDSDEDQCPTAESHFAYELDCPVTTAAAYSWSLKLLLLVHDAGALIMHSLLSTSAIVMLTQRTSSLQ